MSLQVPGRSYTKYFTSFVLTFALLLFSILLGWIYFSTSQAIKEQQRVSIDLNNRNSARVLDSKKEQLRVTLNQIATRYVWFAGRGGESSQQILNGIVNRDKEHFRLDMLRFLSADHSQKAVADSPFFDFQGLDEILLGSHEQHFGNARLLQVGSGDGKLWMLVRGKKLIDPRSGKVLGILFGGVVLNDNVPLCREMLKRSSGAYVSLATGDSIISSSSPLPESVVTVFRGKQVIPGTITVRSSPADTWRVSISSYERNAGIPLYMILVYKDTLQTQLRQTLLYSGGFGAVLTIGIFLLFGRFFSSKTRQAISNLLNFTRAAVDNDAHSSYSPGIFREFNQIGMAVESMLHSLDETAEKLVEAKEKAEGASHAKSVFLASMSHELRTPLNAILGYAQLMENDRTLSRQQRGNIRVMYQAGDHLLRLINDILDLSKIEAGKLGLVEKEFALVPFFDGIVDIIQVRSREKDLSFFYETPDALPLSIVADELRLRQVVLNLLANAVKFTDKGFCSLKIEVEPSDSSGKVQLKISVVDTGPGVSSLMQEKIFDPFQQSGERLKYSEGAGLGLAISKKLISEMDGKIDLKSPVRHNPPPGEGVGSCFSFVLDVKSSGRMLVATKIKNIVSGYHSRGQEKEKKVKILIVDDQLSNRAVLKDSLEPLGFTTEEAVDGAEVTSVCASFKPDLILMDLQMPEVDGVEATKMLKEDKHFSGIPVIAITAAAGRYHQSQEALSGAGFCDCIYKPYQVDELLALLAKHLNLELQSDELDAEQERLEELITPPEYLLKQIVAFTELGDINGLETMAEAILKMDSGAYRVFGEQFADLVENIQLSRIEKLITTLLKR